MNCMLCIFWLQRVEPDRAISPEIVLALLCVIVASSVALAVSIGFARRMQQIADQKPRPPSQQEERDAGDDVER
jgi:hypothetical protein